jgi:hypothetical protein
VPLRHWGANARWQRLFPDRAAPSSDLPVMQADETGNATLEVAPQSVQVWVRR